MAPSYSHVSVEPPNMMVRARALSKTSVWPLRPMGLAASARSTQLLPSYSHVAPGPYDAPPNRTARPRAASKAIAGSSRGGGLVVVVITAQLLPSYSHVSA